MSKTRQDSSINRRRFLGAGAVAAAAGVLVSRSGERTGESGGGGGGGTKGRINHSLVPWCYEPYWKLDEMCKRAKKLGCKSIELCDPKDWPTLKQHGLTCAISPSHLFVQGMNNPKYQPGCIAMLKQRIDQSVEFGVKTVITFTGYAQESGDWANGGIPDVSKLPADRKAIAPDEGIKNCVAGFKQVIGYAEEKKIALAIEMLNSRVTDHPMKGHPGYQGDHIDYCMEIVKQVGSDNLGLLFDLYHVQIMDGDIIRRIRQCGGAIKHVHVAGVPGRGELDEKQEINFPPAMRALLDINYKGFVGQEFIPTRDPWDGLKEAIKLCDV
jgi:hydroxypyruvate isomerase